MRHPIKVAIAGAFVFAGLLSRTIAGPLEDGGAAYKRGDYAVAFQLLQPLAVQGNALAQVALGRMYLRGQGAPQNNAQAVAWTRRAADQGQPAAELILSWMYERGQGVPPDEAQALSLRRKAAEQGYAAAQFTLGWMYKEGHGVPQDFVQAYTWLNLAVSRFPAWESADRDEAISERDLVAARMTPAQIAVARSLATAWKPVPPAPQARLASPLP